MAFIDNRDLKVHVRHVHENFRPFECEACHQAYKTKQGLSTHQKAHPNGECINLKKTSLVTEETIDGEAEAKSIIEEKPFGCPECKKRFTKKSRMELHLRTHSNENRFSCSVEGCGKFFTQNQSLRQHMKQIHNLQLTSTSTVSTTGTTTDSPTLSSQEATLSQNLPNHNSSNINQVLSDADMNMRHIKQETQVQPLTTQLSQQSSLNINLPQSKVVNLNTKFDDDLQGSGRDSVMSHVSDMSTNSRSSVVVVEPRNQQITHQTNNMLQKTSCSTNSLLQTPLQQLSSISQSQSSGQSPLSGMTAQLAAHNTTIPSVAAKAAEAVFGRNTVINNAGDHLRDMRQGATGSWMTGAQANQHSTTIGVSPTTSQFMPLNLQEALVQHQQQNPRLISNAIAQVRSPSALQESASTVAAAVVPNQHQSTTFHHMIQQQQQLLIQQQQQQQEHQRRLTEQKDQRERERLLRERQVREHERQQREQQEHYQRYQLHQQQQLLQQQQQLAAAQAAAQVQQAQVQQSVVGGQQAPSSNPSTAGGLFQMSNLH